MSQDTAMIMRKDLKGLPAGTQNEMGSRSWYAVHMRHCCMVHGCKYGENECPVVNEIAQQDHPCAECKEQEEEEARILQDYWSRHYAKGPAGCCTLCGNTGIVDTIDSAKMPNGVTPSGARQFCFCANGRELRKDGNPIPPREKKGQP
jgi:hypothetical protein